MYINLGRDYQKSLEKPQEIYLNLIYIYIYIFFFFLSVEQPYFS